MKINSIATRYILKELYTPFGLNVLFFTFLFLMTEMIKITNWIVNYNIGILTVLVVILYTIPWFLMFILPMSVMLSILLTFLRLSSDNEIIALKSCGLSVFGLLPPVVIFSFIGFALTLLVTIYAIPWSRASIEDLALKVAASNINIGLKERTFNDSFKDVVLYVNKIDLKNKKLVDIFIEDKRQPDIVVTVTAPEGQLFSEPEKMVFHLRLSGGTIHQTNLEKRSAHSIHFDTYNLTLDMKDAMQRNKERSKSREELSITELNAYIQQSPAKDTEYYKVWMVLHRRFAIPVSCFALGLLAFPLGIQSRATKRPLGLVLGLASFLLYYLLLTMGYALGETGTLPPIIGMWLPNVVVGAMGLYFLIQTARERTLKISVFFRRVQQHMAKMGGSTADD